MSRAKPGRDDGFVAALAWLGVLKSQSQAVKPRLFGTVIYLAAISLFHCKLRNYVEFFGGGKIISIW